MGIAFNGPFYINYRRQKLVVFSEKDFLALSLHSGNLINFVNNSINLETQDNG